MHGRLGMSVIRLAWRTAPALVASIGTLCFAQPASARDRPGTPGQEYLRICDYNPAEKAQLCGGFVDLAETETVRFEIETTVDMADTTPFNSGRLTPHPTTLQPTCGANTETDSETCFINGKKYNGDILISHTHGPQGSTHTRAEHRRGLHFWFKDLQFNTRYCFRVRSRNADNDVVSENFSNWACAQTKAAPPMPQPPKFTVRFLGTQWLTNPRRQIPETVDVIHPAPLEGGVYTTTVGTTVRERYTNLPYDVRGNSYPVSGPAELTIGMCLRNITGNACHKETYDVTTQELVTSDGRTIVHTGRNKDGTSNVAQGPFAGTWITDTDQNARFRIVATVTGNQVTGTGTDIGGDQKYNMTFTGTITGTIVRLAYVQPAVNGSGAITFVMIGKDGINGSGVVNDTAKTTFKIKGRRE